eukprot:scaffold4052_cov64-Attheya_sp.AAC.9
MNKPLHTSTSSTDVCKDEDVKQQSNNILLHRTVIRYINNQLVTPVATIDPKAIEESTIRVTTSFDADSVMLHCRRRLSVTQPRAR